MKREYDERCENAASIARSGLNQPPIDAERLALAELHARIALEEAVHSEQAARSVTEHAQTVHAAAKTAVYSAQRTWAVATQNAAPPKEKST